MYAPQSPVIRSEVVSIIKSASIGTPAENSKSSQSRATIKTRNNTELVLRYPLLIIRKSASV